MIIYKVTNKTNKKSYIGRTKALLAERKKQHIRASKKETNNVFHKALKELGEDAFTWEVIQVCGVEESKNLEIYYIGCFNSYESGYNSIIVSNNNKKINLGKPISYRLSVEDENILIALAEAAGVSPGIFTRLKMEEILGPLKFLIMEQ